MLTIQITEDQLATIGIALALDRRRILEMLELDDADVAYYEGEIAKLRDAYRAVMGRGMDGASR